MKIIKTIFLFAIGVTASWYFLPEKYYEIIGKLLNSKFVMNDMLDASEEKKKALISFIFGFLLLCSVSYKVFRERTIYFILAFGLIFIGIFIGILINTLLFQRNNGEFNLVNTNECMKMWIILPVIVLLQIMLKFIVSIRVNKRAKAKLL